MLSGMPPAAAASTLAAADGSVRDALAAARGRAT
jgi:hypothetical protein